MKRSTIFPLLFALVMALIVRELFPKSRDVLIPGPPSRPDTIFVNDTTIRTDTLFKTRTVFSTDTVNLVQTMVIADTVRVPIGAILPIRKYITEVNVGKALGDSTWITGTSFRSDSVGMQFVEFAESLWTSGPLDGIRAEGDSIRVDFGSFPKDRNCGFFCRVKLIGLGVGAGILLKEIAR